VRETLIGQLTSAYESVEVGDPRISGTLMGPLIDRAAFDAMQAAVGRGAKLRRESRRRGARCWKKSPRTLSTWRPALVLLDGPLPVSRRETFAPILYVIDVDTLEEAIRIQNDVPQGCRRASSPPTCARPSDSSRLRAATVGLRT